MRFEQMFVLSAVALALIAGVAQTGAAGDDPYLAEGLALLDRQEYSGAARSLEQAIRRGNRSAEAYAGLGRAYLRLGDSRNMVNVEQLEKGAAALRSAEELDPARSATHFDLGMSLLALGDREGAALEARHLEQRDAGLAARLGSAIAGHQQPPVYRLVGEGGRGESSGTPVDIRGNTVFVPVVLSLGGRSVQVRLILDTGASITTITPEVAAQLDIRLSQAMTGSVQVVGGGTVKAHGARVDSVSVGPHTKSGMNVAVIANTGTGLRYDGLLGMDFLRGLRYHVDFKKKVVTWTQ